MCVGIINTYGRGTFFYEYEKQGALHIDIAYNLFQFYMPPRGPTPLTILYCSYTGSMKIILFKLTMFEYN